MRFVILAMLLMTASCDGGPTSDSLPKINDVERLEAQLAREKCIGNLSGWERRYQFWTNVYPGGADEGRTYKTIIDFRLRQASGYYGVHAGRSRLPPQPSFSWEIDDKPVKMAWGKFDIASGQLKLDHCGPNFPRS